MISSTAFNFQFMAIGYQCYIERRSPSNKICHQLQPKKIKLILAGNKAAKGVSHTVHYYQDGAQLSKVGVSIRWHFS